MNETKLTQINNLRTNATLKEALITTYEHQPLIGVTKITDSKGVSSTYEYDTSNRLKAIKDEQGNILESYQYNYKQ
ncbi:RHS repeat domain-containing protein [Myroides odoratus]|uniref:RHS repeat domain-containing protein n=1 Tax=Myroides odoratus TaxID=256 RepID=UPI0039B0233C